MGVASVMIYVTNINDEKPQFAMGIEEILASVREDLEASGYVTMIQATDPDGDNVEYYFTGKWRSRNIWSHDYDTSYCMTLMVTMYYFTGK